MWTAKPFLHGHIHDTALLWLSFCTGSLMYEVIYVDRWLHDYFPPKVLDELFVGVKTALGPSQWAASPWRPPAVLWRRTQEETARWTSGISASSFPSCQSSHWVLLGFCCFSISFTLEYKTKRLSFCSEMMIPCRERSAEQLSALDKSGHDSGY